ncbi:hypothetical protein POSPLADRAFT_1058874 [Postia placenta MAD-698-R-SB12]|uniref:Uncharacterized protein n=1 Tax=Postia placenta MAD-698-R-SB12 TaxID=670580 RepID=A0A1X6MWT3_9APHY|nr:hypothetical protein POSPLADRAFT_1058874 [Postia placenta MAD-698-R-SB12]OSX60700.1 hypothetical protein POSPLADRAFT_1058874 [Postia placenta MAD-698-R-SB12]
MLTGPATSRTFESAIALAIAGPSQLVPSTVPTLPSTMILKLTSQRTFSHVSNEDVGAAAGIARHAMQHGPVSAHDLLARTLEAESRCARALALATTASAAASMGAGLMFQAGHNIDAAAAQGQGQRHSVTMILISLRHSPSSSAHNLSPPGTPDKDTLMLQFFQHELVV